MKRYVSLILFLIIVLCSCSRQEYTSTDLLYVMMEKLSSVPASSIYFSEAEENGENSLGGEAFRELYDGMSPLDLCESYALLVSRDDSVYEIHVYKGVSQIKCAEIEKILYRRIEMIQDKDLYLYDESNYENVISRARVVKKGRYVLLLATDMNDKLEDTVKDII